VKIVDVFESPAAAAAAADTSHITTQSIRFCLSRVLLFFCKFHEEISAAYDPVVGCAWLDSFAFSPLSALFLGLAALVDIVVGGDHQSVLRGRKDRLQADSLDEELYDDDELSTDDDLFG